jgi:hypothetical protein
MSPIIRIGDRCERCHQRGVWDLETGLCSPCWRSERAFGRKPEPRAPTRFDALVQAGEAHSADSREFEQELYDWLS